MTAADEKGSAKLENTSAKPRKMESGMPQKICH
jgi:hypothetical protein